LSCFGLISSRLFKRIEKEFPFQIIKRFLKITTAGCAGRFGGLEGGREVVAMNHVIITKINALL
jgi:hypothetical protein